MLKAHESVAVRLTPDTEKLPPVSEPSYWEFAPGQCLAWCEYGDPAGEPVMYYHGWPSSRLQVRLAHHLARERGLRLIACDRPGMGRSSFIAGRTLATWPDMMSRFADALGIGSFGQIAVSGGAPYAIACAATIPGRITATMVLSGAVLLHGLSQRLRQGLHPVYRLIIPFRKTPAVGFNPLLRMASFATRLDPRRLPLSLALGSLPPADRIALLDEPSAWQIITESFREAAIGGGRGVMADSDIYFQAPPFQLTEIHHPIQWWHGTEDRNIPLELVREFLGGIPSATLTASEGLGHFSCALHNAPAALDRLCEACG